jgi:hypothetical protein
VQSAYAVAATGAGTAETVVAAAPAGGTSADAVATRAAAVPPPAVAKAAARGPLIVVASIVVALGLVAAGGYVWMRGPAAPAPADVTPAAEQAAAATAPAVTLPEPSAAQVPAPALEPAPPAPPPASASPAATSTPGTVQAPGRKPQAKPAAGPKPAAPVSAPPVPATTAPPAVVVSPPAAPAPAAAKVPDVSYRKVKLITQAGSSEKSTDVVLQFSDDRLSVTPAGGGAALRTVRYAEVTAASYSKAEKKRLGFIKSAQHLLALETAGEPLLLRLDNDNFQPILAAVEARTGQAVSR